MRIPWAGDSVNYTVPPTRGEQTERVASGLAFAGQPLIEPAQVDHHALVGAAADLLLLVARIDVELDAPAVDLRNLGFGRDVVPHGRCRHLAHVRGSTHRALALPELNANGVQP